MQKLPLHTALNMLAQRSIYGSSYLPEDVDTQTTFTPEWGGNTPQPYTFEGHSSYYLPKPYESRISEYNQLIHNNADAMACIKARAEDGSKNPRPVWEGGDAGEENTTEEQAVEDALNLLLENSLDANYMAFFHLAFWKETYVELIFGDSRGPLKDTPVSLHVHHSACIRIRSDANGEPTGFVKFEDSGSSKTVAEFENYIVSPGLFKREKNKRYMVHIKIPSDISDFYGVPSFDLLGVLYQLYYLDRLGLRNLKKGFPKFLVVSLKGADFKPATKIVPGDGTVDDQIVEVRYEDQLQERITNVVDADGQETLIIRMDNDDGKSEAEFEDVGQDVDAETVYIGLKDSLIKQLIRGFDVPPFRVGIIEDGNLGNTSGQYQLAGYGSSIEGDQVRVEVGLYRPVTRKTPVWTNYKGELFVKFERIDTSDRKAESETLDILYKTDAVRNGEIRSLMFTDLVALPDELNMLYSEWQALVNAPAQVDPPDNEDDNENEDNVRALVAQQQKFLGQTAANIRAALDEFKPE